jgi:hypothetical protein
MQFILLPRCRPKVESQPLNSSQREEEMQAAAVAVAAAASGAGGEKIEIAQTLEDGL